MKNKLVLVVILGLSLVGQMRFGHLMAQETRRRGRVSKPTQELTHEQQKFLVDVRSGDIAAVKDYIAKGGDVTVLGRRGHTSLAMAALRGNTEMMQLLLNASRLKTGVMRAVPKEFLAGGLFESTPLHEAARQGNIEGVKALLKAGASVDAKVPGWGTPLIDAALSGKLEVVKAIAETKKAGPERTAYVNATAPETPDRTALASAAEVGSLEIVTYLFEQGATITPGLMSAAVQSGNEQLINLLVNRGANINEKDERSQATPLHFAAFQGLTSTVKLLLEKGAEVNAKAAYGLTPLFGAAAAQKNSLEIINILLASGADPLIKSMADPNMPFTFEFYPVELAVLRGDGHVVKALLDAAKNDLVMVNRALIATPLPDLNIKLALSVGGPAESTDETFSYTKMFDATQEKELINELLNRGASINAKSIFGITPVMTAVGRLTLAKLFGQGFIGLVTPAPQQEQDNAKRQARELIDLLISKGADINLPLELSGVKLGTMMHFATFANDLEIITLLLERKANVNAVNDFGIMPLQLAAFSVYDNLSRVPREDLDARQKIMTPAIELLQKLINAGADVNAKIKFNYPAGTFGEFETEIFDGFQRGSTDYIGKTVLHLVVKSQEIELVNVMLSAPNIDVNAQDTEGKRPLDYAEQQEIRDALIAKGAKTAAG